MSGLAAAAIGAGGAIIGGAFKFFEGQSQKKQAAQIAKNNPFSPEVMPWQVTEATKLAQENYTNEMPGMQEAKQGISQAQANAGAIATKGATSSGDILDAANKIDLAGQDATRQLAVQAASYKSNALGGYEAALGTQAGWSDQLYKNNQLQPYLRAANTAASLQGAGSINEFSGIDTAATGLTAAGQEYGNFKFNKYMADRDKYNPDGTLKNFGQYYGNSQLSASGTNKLDTNSILALSALGQY